MKLISTFLITLLITTTVDAQKSRIGNWCGTDQTTKNMFEKKEREKTRMMFENYIQQYIANGSQNKKGGGDKSSPYIIPVVFHCITDNGDGYCSKASVEAQMTRLNQDFQRLNSDTNNTRLIFKPYAMSMNIEFRLAHIDPNGNCTEGIVRADSPLSTDANNAVKAVSYWNSKKYFNIWVVNSIAGSGNGTTLGYAQFPFSGINNTYGVVIDNDYVSSTDRTLTHELGHCFGLLHTFQSGCGNSCSNSGDNVCDTPPSFENTFGCDVTQNTCSNDASGASVYTSNVVDQIENYMSYDDCQNMFTLGQKVRMEAVLNSTNTTTGLDQLNTPANHAATGVANPYNPNPICTPIADFTYNKEYICEGDSVSFYDNSYNATPTTWNWTFTGGSPSTSNISTPKIAYNTAGVYSVTHQPGTTAGTGSETKNNIITVSSLVADYTGSTIEGFEVPAQVNTDWRIENPEGQGWQTTTFAASSGTYAMRIRNSATTNDGEMDDLISPSFDLTNLTANKMTFKQAFVRKNSANSDRLIVYSSVDCGNTWQLKLPLSGPVLTTGANQTGTFSPTPSDFVERTIDLATMASETNVRFKFEFKSGGGNDIYIDDINIGGAVGINDLSNIASFSIYPNPTNSNAQISFNLTKNVEKLNIKIINTVGQKLTDIVNQQAFSAGKYTLKIDQERKLAAGIYFIVFDADDHVKTQKLIIQ